MSTGRPGGSPSIPFLGTLTLAASTLITGCAGVPNLFGGPAEGPPKAAAATISEERPLAELSAEELAARAQRDVEAVLNRRSAAAEPPPPAARDEVRWSEPGRVARSVAPDAGPDSVAAGALHRPEEELEPIPPAPAPAPTPIPAAAALETDRVGGLLVDLSRELYRESSYADAPLRQLMAIAAQSIVDPNRALAPEAIPGLTDRERELLGHYQAFCLKLGQRLREGEDAELVLAEAVTQLQTVLVEAPTLTISSAELCYRVGGFGDYDVFEPHRFLAHAEQRVILYQEIEDFQSRLNDKGEWVTELSQQLVIYADRDGIPVWTDVWQPTVDVSRKRRQDFFTVQMITLPQALGVGRYHLKVRVRDEQSTAETEHSVVFEMVADPKMAAKVR